MNLLRSLKKASLLVGLMGLIYVPASHATPIQLLTNGDFEAGSLAGWTVTDTLTGTGSFFLNSYGGTGPASGFVTPANAAGGGFFAHSDQTGPGAHAISQTFVVTPGSTSVSLSFDMFFDDYSGIAPVVDPSGLDETSGGTGGVPNQHGRIDILTAGASPLSTAAADIITSILAPIPAPAFPAGSNPFIPSPTFDLTAFVGSGGTFQVRFAEVDNIGNILFGIDNVSILADTAIPAPGTYALIALGMLGLITQRRRTQ